MALSVTSRLFRALCTPLLFAELKVAFALRSLHRLTEASRSEMATHVQTVCYEAAEIIDPLVGDWDAFQVCFYTRREYKRDRRESRWDYGLQEISYPAIYSYFSRLSCEQQDILLEDRDLMAFMVSLPRFPNLRTVRICFGGNFQRPFRWIVGRVLLGGQACFPDQLEKIFRALLAAREHGVSIRTLEIRGYYPRRVVENVPLQKLARDALSSIATVRIIDSPAMLEFLGDVPLPCLRRCELESCWLSVPNLERFVWAHRDTIRSLHLDDMWRLSEQTIEDGIQLSFGSTTAILESIATIRESGILNEFTMNRQPSGRFEIREAKD
ncbi:hypothetical protein FE257_002304 [Aspergillus nanangensis]|uniref:Uncharacterized protein n=1 Tax=Aspergillus nanangensis TaxID=2582783 RepID=A0AAD4CCS0_ASPNN|nr:hypothetical protein FE257_002304 [Aspergillus nanangensis]